MSAQQNPAKRQQAPPSRMMRVAPNVTDPTMQSNKSQADAMLAEMGENPDSVDEVVFNRKKPTKEELDHQANAAPAPSTDNTMLIIIFALIVIALVAIIVWMIMKQGTDKKEEEEIKRMIQPHPRNGMPPMNRYPVNQQQYDALQQQRQMQHRQRMQQRGGGPPQPNRGNPQQQSRNQQQGDDENDNPEDEEEVLEEDEQEDQHSHSKQAQKKSVGSSRPKNSVPNASGTVTSASEEDRRLSDKAEADAEAPSEFTKDNPHPDILKPGKPNDSSSQPKSTTNSSDVDDIMRRTEAMLSAKPTTKATKAEASNVMNDADRALLDRMTKQNNEDEDDEEDDEDDDE